MIFMKRGEIWLVNLDPTLGSELRKTRPAIIVSSDEVGRLPLKVIVPLTDWKDYYEQVPWMVRVEPTAQTQLSKRSAADCFQVRSVAQERLIRRIGQISEETLTKIVRGLGRVFEF